MAIKTKDYFEKLPEGRRRVIEERARELLPDAAGTGPSSSPTRSGGEEMRPGADRRHDGGRQGEDRGES